MGDIAKHARRILGGVRKGTTEKVFPGYVSFESESRPRWWRSDFAKDGWGRVLGVHEDELGSRVGAIVVMEAGLAILDEAQLTWLSYRDISGWEPLSKEPVSKTLVVRRKSGSSVELRFHLGGAFAFVQFLISALKEDTKGLAE